MSAKRKKNEIVNNFDSVKVGAESLMYLLVLTVFFSFVRTTVYDDTESLYTNRKN